MGQMNGNTSQVQSLSCLQTARWRSWASSCHSPMSTLSVSPVKVLIAAAAKSLQSCPTLWDPIDSRPSGSPFPGILQARTLEWVAISFSNAWKWKVKVKSLSRVWLLATHGLQPTRLLHPWDFPGKSTGVGHHCLLWKYLFRYLHIFNSFISGE